MKIRNVREEKQVDSAAQPIVGVQRGVRQQGERDRVATPSLPGLQLNKVLDISIFYYRPTRQLRGPSQPPTTGPMATAPATPSWHMSRAGAFFRRLCFPSPSWERRHKQALLSICPGSRTQDHPPAVLGCNSEQAAPVSNNGTVTRHDLSRGLHFTSCSKARYPEN